MNDSAFVFIDLETPNRTTPALCSIGIITRSPNSSSASKYILVDPETYFDAFNISIHGLTPETVAGEIRFPELWHDHLAPLFTPGHIIVGHNVSFDLRILAGTYRRYFHQRFPEIPYICTLALARKHDKETMPNHRLITCCQTYGIPLANYHNALADITATAALFDVYYPKITERDIRLFAPH